MCSNALISFGYPERLRKTYDMTEVTQTEVTQTEVTDRGSHSWSSFRKRGKIKIWYHHNAVEGWSRNTSNKKIDEYFSYLFCKFKTTPNLIKYHQHIYAVCYPNWNNVVLKFCHVKNALQNSQQSTYHLLWDEKK